jgi:mono/diheme cytochrome c family protein
VHHIRFVVAAITALLLTAGAACAQEQSFGDRLFHDKADCQFCHGPDGDGHGDPRSPGKAANLHETILNRDQLVEVIACGRPGTEMPHFNKYAYDDEDDRCYGMLKADVGKDIPPDPHSTPLTKHEIDAVADYILANYKGK